VTLSNDEASILLKILTSSSEIEQVEETADAKTNLNSESD
jgi:hypothetical protein